MRSVHKAVGLSAALAALIWAQAAGAQFWGGSAGEFGGIIPDPPVEAWLPCADGSCGGETAPVDTGTIGSGLLAAPDVQARTALPTEALTYTPSTQRRTRNLTNFVAKTRAKSPTEAAQLEQLFASTDIVGQVGSMIAPLGLSTDNVADAYTLYWISAWNGANGIETSPDRAQFQAVRQQAAAALSVTDELAGADDARKQEMAEVLLLQSVLIDQAVTSAKNDPATLRQVAAAVRQGASATGLDLDRMNLTPSGFVAR